MLVMSKAIVVYLGIALLRRLSKDLKENTAQVLCPLLSGLPGAGRWVTKSKGIVTAVSGGQEEGFGNCSRLIQELGREDEITQTECGVLGKF